MFINTSSIIVHVYFSKCQYFFHPYISDSIGTWYILSLKTMAYGVTPYQWNELKDPVHDYVTEAPCEAHDVPLRTVQIWNLFGTTTKVLHFVVLWCDTSKMFLIKNCILNYIIMEHYKCVLLTTNNRLAWNSKVINWQKKAEMSTGVTPVLSHHRTKMSHQTTRSL